MQIVQLERDPVIANDACVVTAQSSRFGNAARVRNHPDLPVHMLAVIFDPLGFVLYDQAFLKAGVMCRDARWAAVFVALECLDTP